MPLDQFQVEWKYLDPKKLWGQHRMTLLSVNGEVGQFRGDCPWRGRHKSPDSICAIIVGDEPEFKCNDEACKGKLWEDVIEKWTDAWSYSQPPQDIDPDDKPNEDDGFEALGFTLDNRYVYQSASNGHIVYLGGGEHTELKLYQLVPSGSFWKHWCNSRRKNSTDSGISWKLIAREMIRDCHAKGYYLSNETRGSGIFTDKDRIVVNLGSCLLVNNPGEKSFTPVHMANFKGAFSYASPKRITLPPPLGRAELDQILPLLQAMPLADKSEALILAGSIVCGHLAGALEWRPHFWLYAGAGAGKSDILQLIVTALQPTQFYYKGATSAAGVRDDIRNASGLVAIDEVEKMGGSSERMSSMNAMRRVDELTEMMRSASDGSVAKVAKGGPGGTGYAVQIRCCAFFASIYYGIEMAQDYRRFCFISLSNPATRDPNQKRDYKARIRPLIKKTFTPEFAMQLYSWSVVNSRWILETIEFFRQNMLDFTKDAGESDQWGTVLGAAWCLTRYGEQPTAKDVEDMFREAHNNMESLAWEMLDASHGEQVFAALMQSKPQGQQETIGSQVEAVRRAMKLGLGGRDLESQMWLAKHGVIVAPSEGKKGHDLLVCPGHRQLRRIMADEGYRDYKQAFMSRKGVEMRRLAEPLDFGGYEVINVIVVPLKPMVVDKGAEERAVAAKSMTAEDVASFGRQE